MKTKIKFPIAQVLAVITLATGFISCKKDATSIITAQTGKQSIMVYLNDDPVPNLLKVLVDFRYIEVKIDTDNVHHNDDFYNDDHDSDNDHHDHDKYGKWDTLSLTNRVYDLLKLKNGADTLIANSFAHTGKITKIRITLGINNSIWTDSTHTYPLTICDNKSYVYVRVMSNTLDTLSNGQVRIRMDFDVARSVEYENGSYCFEPKLKCYSDNNSGRIIGVVKPRDAHARIMAYNSTDTTYAIPEDDGVFKIRGLLPSTYSVLYKGSSLYKDTTINSILVQAAREVQLPTIVLHQ